MEDKICLDTDFLVNFLREKEEEVEFVKNNEVKNELATTFINIFELYYGAFKSAKQAKNLEAVNRLINRLNLLNFSLESSKKAGEILSKLEKKGNLIEFRDLFIGTIALVNGYSVKTNNLKDFKKIEELRLVE